MTIVPSSLRSEAPAVDALKRCPFCGAAAALEECGGEVQVSHLHREYIERWVCSCTRCGVCGQSSAASEDDAVASWNTREGWRLFDPAVMQDLGFYIVEFADSSVGMDTWEVEEGWQQIDPDASVAWVFLLARREPDAIDRILAMTSDEIMAEAVAEFGSKEAALAVADELRAKMLATVDAHMAAQAPTPDPAVMRDYIVKLTTFFIDNPKWAALAEEARGYVGAPSEKKTT